MGEGLLELSSESGGKDAGRPARQAGGRGVHLKTQPLLRVSSFSWDLRPLVPETSHLVMGS